MEGRDTLLAQVVVGGMQRRHHDAVDLLGGKFRVDAFVINAFGNEYDDKYVR